MGKMSELIENLQLKCIDIHSHGEGEENPEWFVNIFIENRNIKGWENLIKKLNVVFDNPYRFIRHGENAEGYVLCTIAFSSGSGHAEKRDKEIGILAQCVLNEEYIDYIREGDTTLDLKLGISCNNNCRHCVIKPIVYEVKDRHPDSVVVDMGIGMQCSRDLKFMEVIDILDKVDNRTANIVITGGEPTIRKDLVGILKWIYFNKPHTDIAMQTNGRNLCDINLVKAIRRYTRDPSFAVAMRGLEETHNFIVNNRKEKGNPFKETVQGIRNLISVFDRIERIRTEIVASSYNIDELFETVKFHYEDLGVRLVGISYPHLCDYSPETINEVAPDFSKFIRVMDEINQYIQIHEDLSVIIEEAPFCAFNQLKGEIKLDSFENRCKEDVRLNLIGEEQNNFHTFWLNDHAKYRKCKDCLIDKECVGVWKESMELMKKSIIPIKTLSADMQDFLRRQWNDFKC